MDGFDDAANERVRAKRDRTARLLRVVRILTPEEVPLHPVPLLGPDPAAAISPS